MRTRRTCLVLRSRVETSEMDTSPSSSGASALAVGQEMSTAAYFACEGSLRHGSRSIVQPMVKPTAKASSTATTGRTKVSLACLKSPIFRICRGQSQTHDGGFSYTVMSWTATLKTKTPGTNQTCEKYAGKDRRDDASPASPRTRARARAKHKEDCRNDERS